MVHCILGELKEAIVSSSPLLCHQIERRGGSIHTVCCLTWKLNVSILYEFSCFIKINCWLESLRQYCCGDICFIVSLSSAKIERQHCLQLSAPVSPKVKQEEDLFMLFAVWLRSSMLPFYRSLVASLRLKFKRSALHCHCCWGNISVLVSLSSVRIERGHGHSLSLALLWESSKLKQE